MQHQESDQLDLQWKIYLGEYDALDDIRSPTDLVLSLYSMLYPPGRLYPIEPVEAIRQRGRAIVQAADSLLRRVPELASLLDGAEIAKAKAEAGYYRVYQSWPRIKPRANWLTGPRPEPLSFTTAFPETATRNGVTPLVLWAGGQSITLSAYMAWFTPVFFLGRLGRYLEGEASISQTHILAMGYCDLAPWAPSCLRIQQNSWKADHTERFRLRLPECPNLVSLARTLHSGSFQLASSTQQTWCSTSPRPVST